MKRSKLKIIECKGTLKEIGRQYGEQVREEIQKNESTWGTKEKIEKAVAFLKSIRRLLSSRLPDVLEEMEGIAEGSGVSLDFIILFNQFHTFCEDWPQSCTSMSLSLNTKVRNALLRLR